MSQEGETEYGHAGGDVSGKTESHDDQGLTYLQNTAHEHSNVFELLIEAVKTHRLGQIYHARYDAGDDCRRNL